MSWYEPLTGERFRDWFLEFGDRGQLGQATPLDPFATSNRNLRRVPEWLRRIQAGEDIGGGNRRREQAVIDLAHAGLVVRRDQGPQLTELGVQVLRGWQRWGIDDDREENEIPRCLVLFRLAVRNGRSDYLRMRRLWQRLRAIASAQQLLAAPAFLYAVSYLDRPHEGFNPLSALLGGLDTLEADDLDATIDWEGLKRSLPRERPEIDDAVDGLSRRIDQWATRGEGRLNFLRAIEAAGLDHDKAVEFLDTLDLDEGALAVCRDVLAESGLKDRGRQIMDLLLRRKNVILYGPPGTGKTWSALRIAEKWEDDNGTDCVFRITFHPSYDYEDFVEGFRPAPDAPEQYKKQPGVLINAIQHAEQCLLEAEAAVPPGVLLLIDEINRGDVARIFGELITYIESDKRGISARLAQSPKETISIPENLYFLGTMNTADKSVSMLDIALRRRFAFVEFPPDPGFYDQPEWIGEIDGLSIGQLLRALNLGLAEIGVEKERSIGHATLAVPVDEAMPVARLAERIQYDVYPLLSEYTYGNRELLRDLLGELVDREGDIAELSSMPPDVLIQHLIALCDTRLPGGGPPIEHRTVDGDALVGQTIDEQPDEQDVPAEG